MKSSPILAFSITALLFCTHASATIVSGNVTGGTSATQGGSFIKLSTPFTDSNPDNTVGNDNFQTPNLYGFDEGQNITLTADINVDLLASTGTAGIISQGGTVASHYIFFDPASFTTQQGTVSFDSNIFGIITSSNNLIASNFLGNTNVSYLNSNLLGLEGGDTVSISDPKTISVNWAAGTPGDYIRVLTDYSPAAVPVPAAFWLFASSLLGFLGFRRKTA